MFYFFIGTLCNLITYYCFATIIAFLFILKNGKYKVVQKRTPIKEEYLNEVKNSLVSLFIFSVIATIVYQTNLISYTKLYYDIQENSIWYYCLFIPLMLLIYDFYFYLTHRIIHHDKLFKLIHLVHHRSKYVSPISALSMHPIEAIINHGLLVILIFTIPMHTSHVYIWVATTILYTTYLHLGVELYSDRFLQTKIGKLIYTSTLHSKHHTKFVGNYGFYTLIWDKLFKTTTK